MKRLLSVLIVAVLIFACAKETNVVYDTHLFQQLQAHNWILDSEKITDSTGKNSFRYRVDTVAEIAQFNSQQYVVRRIRLTDSAVLDTVAEPIIYDNPRRMYYYNQTTQQIIPNQYLYIDTVNAQTLVVIKTDTLKATTHTIYHAQ